MARRCSQAFAELHAAIGGVEAVIRDPSVRCELHNINKHRRAGHREKCTRPYNVSVHVHTFVFELLLIFFLVC